MSEVISVNNVSKRFGKRTVLDNVSMKVPSGVVFALLGENGAGKSTLIRSMLGYTKLNSGNISVCGMDPLKQPLEIRRKVGYVSDSPGLYESRGRGMEGVADSANNAVGQILAGLSMQRTTPEISLAAVIEPLLPPLEELMRGPRLQIDDTTRYNVPQLENLIARTAALATVAMRQGESELALRIWRLNRELQEFAHQFDPLHTHASRNVSMHLLQQLSDRDVEAMGGPDVFRSLIPSVPDERIANMNEARDQAYNRRELLRRNNAFTITLLPKTISGMRFHIVHYYPPLRWLFERQIAVDLERQLNSTSPLSANFLTEASRESLITRFPQ